MDQQLLKQQLRFRLLIIKREERVKRFRFVGRERAYHGMNIGATSVGGMVNNVKTFASVLMPGVVHMRHTHLPEHKFVSVVNQKLEQSLQMI